MQVTDVYECVRVRKYTRECALEYAHKLNTLRTDPQQRPPSISLSLSTTASPISVSLIIKAYSALVCPITITDARQAGEANLLSRPENAANKQNLQ